MRAVIYLLLLGADFFDFTKIEFARAKQRNSLDFYQVFGNPKIGEAGFGKEPTQFRHFDVEARKKHERFALSNIYTRADCNKRNFGVLNAERFDD